MKNNDELNLKHRDNPIPGDVWEEIFNLILVVVHVDNEVVVICKSKSDIDKDSWTWDLSKLDTLSRTDFSKYVTYSSMANKTWCNVLPSRHAWVIDELKNF